MTLVLEPFSFSVPYEKFADKVIVVDANGKELATLEERPAMEHLPPAFGSVITERRRFTWRSDHPARIYWTEAQDGGALDRLAREDVLLVPLGGEGGDIVGGEALRHILDRELVFGKGKLRGHDVRISPGAG